MTALSIRDRVTSTHPRTDPLWWAALASVVVHGGLVALSFWAGPRPGGIGVSPPVVLQAVLVPASPTETTLIASPEPAPFTVPAAPETPAEPAVTANTGATTSPNLTMGSRDWAILRVAAQPLRDRSRVGDLWNRQIDEFPIEIDFPVRPDSKIEARYPPGALAEGREESVVAWIIVDATGAVEEISIPEGSPEFAEAVRVALKDARFIPARNDMKSIRFPIALEFLFALSSGTGTATTVGAK
ncbi:MAG: TonB family protein [Betaproteobacteria bacterium]